MAGFFVLPSSFFLFFDPFVSAQKPRGFVQRVNGGGEADALDGSVGQMLQPFEAEGEVDTAFVSGEGVDFVHDDGADGTEHFARFGAGEQQVERFRRGDEDVRRLAEHGLPVALWGITGAHRHADVRQIQTHRVSFDADARQRHAQVAVDVVVQRLQRGDVDEADALFDFRFSIFDFRFLIRDL